MFNFIEQFYYGNIEPQECSSELTAQMKKKLSELTAKEEALRERLSDELKRNLKIMSLPAMPLKVFAVLTALWLALGSEQGSHTILLWKIGKDDVIMELKKHYTNEETLS